MAINFWEYPKVYIGEYPGRLWDVEGEMLEDRETLE